MNWKEGMKKKQEEKSNEGKMTINKKEGKEEKINKK